MFHVNYRGVLTFPTPLVWNQLPLAYYSHFRWGVGVFLPSKFKPSHHYHLLCSSPTAPCILQYHIRSKETRMFHVNYRGVLTFQVHPRWPSHHLPNNPLTPTIYYVAAPLPLAYYSTISSDPKKQECSMSTIGVFLPSHLLQFGHLICDLILHLLDLLHLRADAVHQLLLKWEREEEIWLNTDNLIISEH